MRFMKELRGKEIIDKNGNTVGLVEDIELTDKGRVTRVIAMPKGIVSKLTREKMHIQIEDIETISKLVMLNKTEEEIKGVYKCRVCGQAFESEKGRKLHYIRQHKKPSAPPKPLKSKKRKR